MSVELRERPRSTVHGTVTDATGEPVEGAEVTMFHQRLRTRDRLADGRSGDDGRYRVEFTPPDDAPGRVRGVARTCAGPAAHGKLQIRLCMV